MTKVVITDEIKHELHNFLEQDKAAELINTYLYYVELKFNLKPVVFVKDKIIYQSTADAVKVLESENRLWRETEIKIGFGNQSVNEATKKIYICPFTGKVFGDNTHPNPQDAIYDWLSKCPENTERIGGLPAKRFYISEDPEVISNYASKVKHKQAISKVVYSSVLNGKLFNSREAVVQDFKDNYLKRLSLVEVQSQNRFQIEDKFLAFIQTQLAEEKIGAFIEAIAEHEEFVPFVERWLE